MSDIVVIGGGAAGMMAAVFAARAGAKVTLLEKNEKLGKKVYITGKGRCNLTNDCDRDEFLAQVPRNPRFLYPTSTHAAEAAMRPLQAGRKEGATMRLRTSCSMTYRQALSAINPCSPASCPQSGPHP